MTDKPPRAFAPRGKLLTNSQIDCAIARRVMGWTASSAHGQPTWNIPVSQAVGRVIYQSGWQPSADMRDAWQVLAKFPFAEWDIILCTCAEGWYCSISHRNESTRYAEADTAPRAICLAALMTHRVDVKEVGV